MAPCLLYNITTLRPPRPPEDNRGARDFLVDTTIEKPRNCCTTNTCSSAWTRTTPREANDGGDLVRPDLNSIMPHSKEAGFGDEIYVHTMDAYAQEWPSEREWEVPNAYVERTNRFTIG